MSEAVAIVIGVGPENGLGAQLSRRFAVEGLHVILSGRTSEALGKVVSGIEDAGGRATPVVADATEEADIVRLFATAQEIGRIQLAVYNVGNNMPGRVDKMTAEYFERCWRICCLGGFLFGREAVRTMLPAGGSLIFTGASASMRGRRNFAAFNSAKGALRQLAMAMAKEYAEAGLHVGHVVIDGPIHGDKIVKGYPDYARKRGVDGMISLEGLTDAFWYLHCQKPQAWTFEVDVRTSNEPW